jgi:hypothetical protein
MRKNIAQHTLPGLEVLHKMNPFKASAIGGSHGQPGHSGRTAKQDL